MSVFSQDHSQTNKRDWEESQVASILFRSGYGAILGNLLNVSIVAYVLSDVYRGDGLVIWFFAGIMLNLVRWIVIRTFINKPHVLQTAQWLNLYRMLTLISGAHFGVLAVFFLNSSEPLYQALVIFMVGGSVSAAVGTHGSDLNTFRLFMLPSMIPLIVRSLMEQTDVHNALAMMLVLLVLVLHRSAGQTRDILRENIAMSYSLNYRATHDPLVALLNRREFKNRFDTVQDQMAKDEIQAIIFIDLNNFKMLNDTYGHQAGDEALVEVSNIIRNSIRRSDVAARFGGDEFVIFMRASGLSDIEAVGQKIIDSIDLYTMPKSNPDAKLGASLGIAYTSNSGVSFETLLKVADQACYKAKKAGLDVPYSKLLEV